VPLIGYAHEQPNTERYPFVGLYASVMDPTRSETTTHLVLTTGEARSLAASLLRAADVGERFR